MTASTDTFCDRNLAQRIYFLAIYHLWRYLQGFTPSEGVKMTNFRLRGFIPVACWERGIRTQSIYRLWLCSKTVLPEYVAATGPRQKISIYVSVVHAHSLAAPFWIFIVCDIVVKQLLGLPRFQILLLIVYDHINTIARLFSDYLGKTNSDNSVGWA